MGFRSGSRVRRSNQVCISGPERCRGGERFEVASRLMPQSLSAVYVHLVFSTKDRRPLLRDSGIREELHATLGGISNRLECQSLQAGGVEDHVHLLARLGRTISQADWVKELKRASCVWIKEQGQDHADFAWQSGYATFSVSASNLDRVTAYIRGQAEHHRKFGFQDEVRALLRRHRVQWEERYLWD